MAEEIEVTPEMIEEGIQQAYELGGRDLDHVVTEIYRAMEAKRREQAAKDGRNG